MTTRPRPACRPTPDLGSDRGPGRMRQSPQEKPRERRALSQPEIENLLAEARTFPPDPAFAAQANARHGPVRRGRGRLRGLLGHACPRADALVDAVRDDARMGPAVRQVVRRRQAQRRLQLPRPARRERASATRSPTTGSASRATRGRSPTPTSSARCSKAANALKELGVETGDRVAIYMPMIPELPIAMLACARLGAPHTVVFGGFSAEALAGRINDAQAKVLITADGGWRRGKPVGLKHHADEALASTPRRSRLDRRQPAGRGDPHGRGPRPLVARHRRAPGADLPARPGRLRAHALPALHVGHDGQAEGHRPHHRRVTCWAPSYTHEIVFDVKPDDVYWCAADIGWVTGHSYIVYGPLANATTGVMYEGAPGHARLGPLVADRRRLQGHDPVLRPDRDPRVHEAGRGVPGPPRPVVAAPARLGRRADQPRGLAVVPAQHRRRPDADRRHLVADRDRHDPDQPVARRDDDQAGLGDVPAPRDRSPTSSTPTARASPAAAAATSS